MLDAENSSAMDDCRKAETVECMEACLYTDFFFENLLITYFVSSLN